MLAVIRCQAGGHLHLDEGIQPFGAVDLHVSHMFVVSRKLHGEIFKCVFGHIERCGWFNV